MHRTTLFIIQLFLIIELECLKHSKTSYPGKSTATSWRQLEPSRKWSTRVTLVMAESEATIFGSFSEFNTVRLCLLFYWPLGRQRSGIGPFRGGWWWSTSRCSQLVNLFCCQEIGKIRDLLSYDLAPTCITLHTDFANACLCRVVLLIASHSHWQHYGTDDMPADKNM